MILRKDLKFIQEKKQDLKSESTLTTQLNKLEKEVLLTLSDLKYNEMINEYNYLGGVPMHDTETKNQLPTHITLGASDLAKIKMGTCPRVGQTGEPFVEQTRMGWVIMSPDR